MKIVLSDAEMKEVEKEGYINLEMEVKGHKHTVYYEVVGKGDQFYEEIIIEDVKKKIQVEECSIDSKDIKKMKPLPPLLHWPLEKRCPNCLAPLIYDFEYCPKCGQCIKYKEN